jgi:hypothetical protein
VGQHDSGQRYGEPEGEEQRLSAVGVSDDRLESKSQRDQQGRHVDREPAGGDQSESFVDPSHQVIRTPGNAAPDQAHRQGVHWEGGHPAAPE